MTDDMREATPLEKELHRRTVKLVQASADRDALRIQLRRAVSMVELLLDFLKDVESGCEPDDSPAGGLGY